MHIDCEATSLHPHCPRGRRKIFKCLLLFFFLSSCEIIETLHDGQLHLGFTPSYQLDNLDLTSRSEGHQKREAPTTSVFSSGACIVSGQHHIYGHYTHWPEMHQMLFVTISCAKSKSLLPCSRKVCVTVVSHFWISERSRWKILHLGITAEGYSLSSMFMQPFFATMSKFHGYWELWSWELHFLRRIKIFLIKK